MAGTTLRTALACCALSALWAHALRGQSPASDSLAAEPSFAAVTLSAGLGAMLGGVALGPPGAWAGGALLTSSTTNHPSVSLLASAAGVTAALALADSPGGDPVEFVLIQGLATALVV